eukprot:5678167-Prymnesium_polylepis.3
MPGAWGRGSPPPPPRKAAKPRLDKKNPPMRGSLSLARARRRPPASPGALAARRRGTMARTARPCGAPMTRERSAARAPRFSDARARAHVSPRQASPRRRQRCRSWRPSGA